MTPPSLELTDRVALVTGAATGIGLATARCFLQAGARVVLFSLGNEALERAGEEIDQAYGPGKAIGIPGDVSREEQVIAAFDETLQRFGRLDIVVNNAAVTFSAPFDEISLSAWQKVIDVNLTGYFLVARQAVRAFKRQGRGGVMVFVGSENALKPSKRQAAYNVSKAGAIHLARSIAEECGPSGIRVNSVLPGTVFANSALWTAEFRSQRAAVHGYDPDRLEEEYRQKNALGVTFTAEEVAEVILFLASDRSAKMTGAMLSLDGGSSGGYVR